MKTYKFTFFLQVLTWLQNPAPYVWKFKQVFVLHALTSSLCNIFTFIKTSVSNKSYHFLFSWSQMLNQALLIPWEEIHVTSCLKKDKALFEIINTAKYCKKIKFAIEKDLAGKLKKEGSEKREPAGTTFCHFVVINSKSEKQTGWFMQNGSQHAHISWSLPEGLSPFMSQLHERFLCYLWSYSPHADTSAAAGAQTGVKIFPILSFHQTSLTSEGKKNTDD